MYAVTFLAGIYSYFVKLIRQRDLYDRGVVFETYVLELFRLLPSIRTSLCGSELPDKERTALVGCVIVISAELRLLN